MLLQFLMMGMIRAYTKINILVNGKTITAIMNDCPTTRQFLDTLPLSLTFSDYASSEKLTYEVGELTTEGSPSGCRYKTSDIIYYSPWKTFCIIYNLQEQYYNGVIKMGTIDGNGIGNFQIEGSVKADFSLANDDGDSGSSSESSSFGSSFDGSNPDPETNLDGVKAPKKLNGGEIAGIAVGSVAFVAIVVGIIIFVVKKRTNAETVSE